jgi:uncharacterized LabA/DUF88 family protein
MGTYISGPTPAYRPAMIFIDGGYLREEVKRISGYDNINFASLSQYLNSFIREGHIHPELIRVYCYDAIVDHKDPKYDERDRYFESIRKNNNYEVKLGRLIRTKDDRYRQKGVDVLLAIDMITKAFLNHYEIALLLGGDDDYVDLVKSIKDLTGKRIYGAYFQEHVSERLAESFDRRLILSEDNLKSHINSKNLNE